MPRDGNGVYSPDWTPAQPNTPISSGNANAMVNDLAEDLNTPRPVSAGGTGQSTAVSAIDALSGNASTVSSAGTTNIVTTSSQNVTISGGTTITGFSTAPAGVKRFITFASSLTLTHHATNLILPGAANITTGAGDTCIAISLGSGNWRVSHYSRAAVPPALGKPTTDQPGLVEKATVEEVYSAAPDKYFSTDLIESASATVVLTDAATVALDWDDFINASVAIGADRILGNPTNGQPNTYRTIEVRGTDASERVLTFGSQYAGSLPELNDISTSRFYRLTITCVEPTRFLVSAQLSSFG